MSLDKCHGTCHDIYVMTAVKRPDIYDISVKLYKETKCTYPLIFCLGGNSIGSSSTFNSTQTQILSARRRGKRNQKIIPCFGPIYPHFIKQYEWKPDSSWWKTWSQETQKSALCVKLCSAIVTTEVIDGAANRGVTFAAANCLLTALSPSGI